MSIGQLYTRLNSWIDSPAMQPVRRFWLTSFYIYLALLILVFGEQFMVISSPTGSRDVACFFNQYGLFMLMVPIYPFVGIYFYLNALYELAFYWADFNMLHDQILLVSSIFFLVVYPLVLYLRQNKYIKHLVYSIPTLLSLLGTIYFFYSFTPSYVCPILGG